MRSRRRFIGFVVLPVTLAATAALAILPSSGSTPVHLASKDHVGHSVVSVPNSPSCRAIGSFVGPDMIGSYTFQFGPEEGECYAQDSKGDTVDLIPELRPSDYVWGSPEKDYCAYRVADGASVTNCPIPKSDHETSADQCTSVQTTQAGMFNISQGSTTIPITICNMSSRAVYNAFGYTAQLLTLYYHNVYIWLWTTIPPGIHNAHIQSGIVGMAMSALSYLASLR